MKQFSNFEEAKKTASYTGVTTQLPAGAYEGKIKNVQYVEAKTEGQSDLINVLWDVSAGEYKDFYKKLYEATTAEDKKWKGRTTIFVPKDDGSERDEWTKNAFARWTNAFEESNSGYVWDWDEKKWKGKKIGLVVGPTGANIGGKSVIFNEVHGCCSIQQVKDGTYNAKLLNQKNRNGFNADDVREAVSRPTSTDSDGFMNVDTEEEVPF